MYKDKKYFGIDISKDVIDVYNKKVGHQQFKNSYVGFKRFFKLLGVNSHCVMEATGYYHSKLAYYLLEKNILVSIVNPLKIKRFIQMNLSKIKTDKSDAKQIYNYAVQMELTLWKGESKTQQDSLQISRLLSVYTKQSTMLKNKIHGEEVLGHPSKIVVQSLKRHLKNLQKEIKKLEVALENNVKKDYKESLTLLKSIPGIGDKTAMMLLVFTDGFNRFTSSKELCSYAGITPIIRESGSSIK